MVMLESERELIERSLKGDLDSWGKIVTRYKQAVFGVALHILGRPADAEDAAQDAFIRAYQSLHTFDIERKFSTWIFTVTANICKNKLRRDKFFSPLKHISKVVGGEDPAKTVARDERHQVLRDALQELDDGYRMPLVLRFYQDMDYKELAEILNLPEGTVKTRARRARLAMREALS